MKSKKPVDQMKKLIFIPLLFLFVSAAFSQTKNGTYRRADENGVGDITFRESVHKKVNVLNFEISIAGAELGTCIGGIRGKANYIDPNTAEYNAELNEINSKTSKTAKCRLIFVFSKNQVIVKEYDCNGSHGAGCQFEGTFKRPNLSKKRKRK